MARDRADSGDYPASGGLQAADPDDPSVARFPQTVQPAGNRRPDRGHRGHCHRHDDGDHHGGDRPVGRQPDRALRGDRHAGDETTGRLAGVRPGSCWSGLLAGTCACGLVGAMGGVIVARFKVAPFITTLSVMMMARGLGLHDHGRVLDLPGSTGSHLAGAGTVRWAFRTR